MLVIRAHDGNKVVEMNFSQALEAVKAGERIARRGWNGKGMWLRLVQPYSDREFSLVENANAPFNSGTMFPWIGMHTADNGFVPWLASQTDLLAEDWETVG